jgi:hypothetical protein
MGVEVRLVNHRGKPWEGLVLHRQNVHSPVKHTTLGKIEYFCSFSGLPLAMFD